ncbi:MAG: hypothetical protein L3J69_05795 [Desulfobacula sp.]|nr:hypothetical protein [Desulfobacula sp.]
MVKNRQANNTEKNNLGRIGDRPYWVVIFSVFVRAAHQVGAAIFLAVFLLDDIVEVPRIYLIIASISGVILLFTEGLRHRQLFRELSGINTIVKLIILGLVYHGWIPAIPAVLFVFLFASFFSHAPKSIRHRLLF